MTDHTAIDDNHSAVSELPEWLRQHATRITSAMVLFLLPWSVIVGLALPSTADARHWALAWQGLDVSMAFVAALTNVLLVRRDTRAALTASIGATMLLLDAWFDVCTAGPGREQLIAVPLAVFIEVPLAVGGLWIANRALTRHYLT